MTINDKRETERTIRYLRPHKQKTIRNLLAALLIWLFGVLVFIPLAETLNWQTKTFISFIFFLAFSLLIFRTISSAKKLIDAFASFPAKKYGVTKGLSYENSITLFRYLLYIIYSLVVYGLYVPFLVSFHPAVNGIILIGVLIWIFSLTLRIFSILLPKFTEWLAKS